MNFVPKAYYSVPIYFKKCATLEFFAPPMFEMCSHEHNCAHYYSHWSCFCLLFFCSRVSLSACHALRALHPQYGCTHRSSTNWNFVSAHIWHMNVKLHPKMLNCGKCRNPILEMIIYISKKNTFPTIVSLLFSLLDA